MAYEEFVAADTINNGTATRFVNKIAIGIDNLSLLCIGDSVSDGPGEWFYLLSQWLGTAYPSHTISYRNWNSGTEAYNSATILSSGTGSRTINVWNVSVPASNSYYVLASRFQTAVVDTAADVVIIAEGHNHQGTADQSMGLFLNLTQSVSDALPDAQIIMSTINPRTDGNEVRAQYAFDQSRRLGARYGYPIVDAYRAFLDYPSYTTALLDQGVSPAGLHPTSLGHQVWAEQAKKPFKPRRAAPPLSQTPSTFSTTDENLLRNSRFLKWSLGASAAPDFWTVSGTGGVVGQGSTTELSPTPARLTTGAPTNQVRLNQTLSIKDQAKVKGRYVTLSARIFVPNTVTVSTLPACFFSYSSDTIQQHSHLLETASVLPGPIKGAYHWVVSTGFIPTSAPNDVMAVVIGTSSAGTVDLSVDRVSMVLGGSPREWSESLLDALAPAATRVRAETTGTIALTASDAAIQRFTAALTANMTVTLPTTNISAGHSFRIIRANTGAFTFTVQTIAVPGNKVFASATQGWVDVIWDGTQWIITASATGATAVT